MKRVHIDFETRSVADIYSMGAWAYAHHPTTEVICLAYAVDNEEPTGLWVTEIGTHTRLHELAKDPNVIFVAHNAFFEQSIWRSRMVRMGFPLVPINRWVCTAAKALASGYPKALENAALALGATQKKDKLGKQIMRKLASPRKPFKGEDPNLIYWQGTAEEFWQEYEYCKQDVRTEREIDYMLPDLSPQEYEIWCYDQLINMRGVHCDIDFCNTAIRLVKETTDKFNAELRELTNGYVYGGTDVHGIKRYLAMQGVVVESLNKENITRLLAQGKLTPSLLRVLQLRQQLGKSSIKKYSRIVDSADSDGIIRGNYIYHGGHTGRWAGAGVQLQNLVRGPENTDEIINDIKQGKTPENVMKTVAECIRGVFIPRKGMEFNVVDYAAIEARMVMWQAQDQIGMQDFRNSDNGSDVEIYVKMAQRIYSNTALTKEDKSERQLGKQAILGCGFGMSGKKFKITCDGYHIDVSEYDAERIVNLYRETYFDVKNYWASVERAALSALQYPGQVFSSNFLKWIYVPDKKMLYCQLPSGRLFCYPQPEIGVGKFGGPCVAYKMEAKGQWVLNTTYGGALVENAVQAAARDLMAYSIPRVEKAGFKVVMHTHDELVTETPKGSNRLDEMVSLMCAVPEWAQQGGGIPIKASGFICERYRKE